MLAAFIGQSGASIEEPWKSGSWGFGWCPSWPGPSTNIENFDNAAFSGDWYEIYRDKDFLFEPYDECVTTTYFHHPDEWPWKFWINTVQWTSWKDPPFKIGYIDGNTAPVGSPTKQAGWFDSKGQGTLGVYYGLFGLNSMTILDTDYTSWALLYSCNPIPFWGSPFWAHSAWLFSRSQTLSQDKIDNAKQILTEKVPAYDWQNQWNATIQGGDCKYVINPHRVPTEDI